MDRQEATRRAAQHALLDALRQFYPQPLVELRNGLPSMNGRPAATDEPPPARSRARAARIREARQRVEALTQTVEDLPIIAVDVDAWAERWQLHALRDLAPHLMAYWARRPVAGRRFWFPTVRPLPPTPRLNTELELHDPAQPLLAAPELDESQADFVARAKAHYRRRAEGVRLPRQLRRHAEWYVRAHVQGWTADRIFGEILAKTDKGDVSTVRKGIAEFARLLSASDGN